MKILTLSALRTGHLQPQEIFLALSKSFRVIICNTFVSASWNVEVFAILWSLFTYVVGQLSSRTRHCVLALAALDKSLSMF